MEEPHITLYLPKLDHCRLCDGENNDLLLVWSVPKLNATVAVASYPSFLKSVVEGLLKRLLDLPELKHVLRYHGELSVMESSKLLKDDRGYYISKSGSKNVFVQLVSYDPEDFHIVSFKELLQIGSRKTTIEETPDVILKKQQRIISYFVTGCALSEYIDQELIKTVKSRRYSSENEGSVDIKRCLRGRMKATSLGSIVYTCISYLVLVISHFAETILFVTSEVCSVLTSTWLHKLSSVSLVSDRIAKSTELKGIYNVLKQQTDVMEYVSWRHKYRNSLNALFFDMFIGILEFLFFRKAAVYYVNKLRFTFITLWVSSYKCITYEFTMRIGKYCKMNNEVALFLSKLLLSKIIVWHVIKPYIRKNFFVVTKIFHYSAILGVTWQVAVLVDLMTIQTIHVAYAHRIMFFITKCSQKYLFSLLQLFKGKKWNEIKQSLDSNDYTREQLFLGTVIFTLLLLIYPTIWIFYIATLIVYLPIALTRTISRGLIRILTRVPTYFIAYNIVFPKTYKKDICIKYGEERGTISDIATSDMKEGVDLGPDGEITTVNVQSELEVRCSPFTTETLVESILAGLKSSDNDESFGSPAQIWHNMIHTI